MKRLLIPLFSIALWWSAAAQDKAPARTEDLQKLVSTLENDGDRQKLVAQLKTLMAAQHQGAAEEVARIIVRSGHSRIPVYKDTRDNIVGILHAKDLLRSMLDTGGKPSSIAELIREPFFVPETKSIRTLLQNFAPASSTLPLPLTNTAALLASSPLKTCWKKSNDYR